MAACRGLLQICCDCGSRAPKGCWLDDQRSASWVLETLQFRREEHEPPVLVLWAHRVGSRSTHGSARAISKDVVEMLLMPEVLVGLHFEREMGSYFEVTSK